MAEGPKRAACSFSLENRVRPKAVLLLVRPAEICWVAWGKSSRACMRSAREHQLMGAALGRYTGYGQGKEMQEIIIEVVNWYEENQMTAK